jgi:hypothetical protein
MRSTTFNPSPALEERLAVPYALDEDGRHVPAVRLKANVWPAGLVYGNPGLLLNQLIAVLDRLDGMVDVPLLHGVARTPHSEHEHPGGGQSVENLRPPHP